MPGSSPPPPRNGDQINLNFTTKEGDRVSVSGIAQVRGAHAADPPGVPPDYFVTSHGGEYFFVPSISALKQFAGARTAAGTSSSL